MVRAVARSETAQADLVERLIQSYAATGSTEVLRELAVQVGKLRSMFLHDGGPDWGGRSWDYRQAMTRIYERSGASPEVLQAVKNGLRYHLGNYLREVLSPEELRAAGLRAASPRDRIEGSRAELLARARAVGLGEPADLAASLDRIEAALRLALIQARAARPAEREAGAEALNRIGLLIQDLRSKLTG